MKKLFILLLLAAAPAFGQCGKLTLNPITGNLDCVGSSATGAANPTATCAGTVTSCAVTITSLALTSSTINTAIYACSDSTTKADVPVTSATASGGPPYTTYTLGFASHTGVICTVNSNGGAGPTGPTGPQGPAGTINGIITMTGEGAVCDGAHQAADSAAFTAAVTAAIAAGGVPIQFPVGTCQLDNSAGVITVTGYNGELYGYGPTSKIVFSTITNNGVLFTGSTSIHIHDVALSYAGTISSRGSLQGILNVYSSSNVVIENVYLSNAPDSGITLSQDQHTKVDGVWCSTLFADCVFGVNLVDASINSVHSVASGDAAVEVSYYSGNTLNACNQITVTNLESKQDVNGFLNNSCQKVALTNSTIDSTSSHGIVIRQDSATQGSQQMYPLNTTISNTTITNSGSGPVVPGVTNSSASGIYFTVSTSTSTKIPVTISNVQVSGSQAYGIQVTDTGYHEWQLDMSNIVVNGTGAGTSGAGGILANGYRVNGSGIKVISAGGSSLTFQDQVSGNWTGFESYNPNVGFGGSDDAIYNSSTGTIVMNGILLSDTNATPVSRINNAAATGAAEYLGITPVMPNGTWQGFTNSNSAGAFCYTSLSVTAQTNCSVPGSGGGSSAPTFVSTTTDPGLTNTYVIFLNSGTSTYNVPSAGTTVVQRCYWNTTGNTGVITIQMATGNTVDKDGTNGSSGGTLVSLAASGNKACITSDGTGNHWYATFPSGTWTNN